MDKKNTTKNLATIITTAAAVIPAVKPAIDAVHDYADKVLEEQKDLVAVPELYSDEYPLTGDQAVKMLEDSGLKAMIIKTSVKDANVKYRNCFESQVIKTQPKAKQKVTPGSSVLVKCITQEVIDESQRLFDESELKKAEAKMRRAERIDNSKESVLKFKDKVASLPKRHKVKKTDESYIFEDGYKGE